MPRNPEDIPVTSASMRVRGDIYSSISDEPQIRIVDSTGQQVVSTSNADPTVTAINPFDATDVPAGFDLGASEVIANYVRFGLYNADFSLAPTSPTDAITPANPMPYWSVGGTATGATDNVQWTVNNNVNYGTTMRVSGGGLQVNDDVWVEQIVPAPALWADSQDYWPEILVINSATPSAATFTAYLSITFYDSSGAAGGASEGSREVTIDGVTLAAVADSPLTGTNPAISTRAWSSFKKKFAKIRFGVRTTAAVSTTWAVEFAGARLHRSTTYSNFTQPRSAVGKSTALGHASGLNALMTYDYTGAAVGMVGPHLTGIFFSTVNLAAGATTQMQLWGDTALALGTPRVEMPYAGSVVAITWRLSAAITAGSITAVRVVTQAGVTIKDFGALGTGSGQTGNIKGSASSGGYGVDTFSSGTNIGVDIVTGGGLTPAGSLDMAVIVWVAFNWTGN